MSYFLSAREINILEEAHRAAQQKRQADRIKSILLLNEGYTYETISHILRLDNTTIRRYEKEYNKDVIDGLLEYHYNGSTGRLTSGQENELTGYLKTHLHQTAKEIRLHIEKTYKVNYSIEGITHLLH